MEQAMAGFAAAVARIQPDQWDLPSPCDGWSVFDVVDHVVAGDRFVVRLMDGASLSEAVEGLVGIDPEHDNPVGSVTGAAAAAFAAFGKPLDAILDHPVGQIPARRFLGFRVIDQVGHIWDIATATKAELDLAPDALAVALAVSIEERPTLEASTNFATRAGTDIDNLDPLSAFLELVGRREAV